MLVKAEAVASPIDDDGQRAETLVGIVVAFEEDFARRIDAGWLSGQILKSTVGAMNVNGEPDQACHLVQGIWLEADTRKQAINLFPIIIELLPLKPETGMAFCEAFTRTSAVYFL